MSFYSLFSAAMAYDIMCVIMSLDREFLPKNGKETVKFSASRVATFPSASRRSIPVERRALLGMGFPHAEFPSIFQFFNFSTFHPPCPGFGENSP
jgi:hypothetical protein